MATSTQSFDNRISRLEQEMQQLKGSTSVKPVFLDPINNGIDLPDGTVTAAKILDGSITAPKMAALSIGSAAIQDLAVTGAHIQDLAVTGAHIQDATIDDAKITSLQVDKLLAGELVVEVNVAVGGKITVGDADPVANGGVLIDSDELTVYGSDGDSLASMGASGITVVSEAGNPFFTIRNIAANRLIDAYMDTNSGRSLWLSSNVGGQLSQLVWIDQSIPINTATSQNDIFSFGAQAVGAIFMVHVHRTDTNASLGHIFAANAAGVLNYVSTSDTEASSAGTTAPYIGLNGSDGLDFGGHATAPVRFVGFCIVIYD